MLNHLMLAAGSNQGVEVLRSCAKDDSVASDVVVTDDKGDIGECCLIELEREVDARHDEV